MNDFYQAAVMAFTLIFLHPVAKLSIDPVQGYLKSIATEIYLTFMTEFLSDKNTNVVQSLVYFRSAKAVFL